MTLTMAWIRSVGNTEELIVSSDSRLTGGHRWDTAPKIISSSRGDCVIAFAGGTDLAYPIMIQVNNSIECFDKSASRQLPLTELKGHLVRVANDMIAKQSHFPPGKRNPPEVTFLLAGYCWKFQGFRIWKIQFDSNANKFVALLAVNWRGQIDQKKRLALIGDDLVSAKSRLIELLKLNGSLSSGGFDMEPFEVLLQMIDDPTFSSIGGNPQMVKVYKSMKTVPFVVRRKGAPSLYGRTLLSYEVSDRFPTVDV